MQSNLTVLYISLSLRGHLVDEEMVFSYFRKHREEQGGINRLGTEDTCGCLLVFQSDYLTNKW